MATSTALFSCSVALGIFVNLCYFTVVWRLVRNGIRVKLLATPKDTIRILRQYRALSVEKELPTWPLAGFWVSLILFSLCGVSWFFHDLLYPRGPEPAPALLRSPLVPVWAAASSFLVAIIFSYKLLRNPEIKPWDWKKWLADKYARNDCILGLLGWAGVLLSLLMLSLGWGR